MYILFDIGGTHMRLAGTRDKKTFFSVQKTTTPVADFEAGMVLFEKMAMDIAGEETIEGIAGGIAGDLDAEKAILVNAYNLVGWAGKPFKETLEQRLGAPVVVENDSSVVGLGEVLFGAGREYPIVVYMTVSTGVGGARIVNGKIDTNRFGFEPGHHIMSFGGEKCPGCGGVGDLESLISGSALKQRTGKNPREILQEDPVWDEFAKLLAVGLNNVSVFWSPDLIVLGGAMIVGTPCIPFEKIEAYFKETVKAFSVLPKLKKAELKDEGGLYGAMALLEQNV